MEGKPDRVTLGPRRECPPPPWPVRHRNAALHVGTRACIVQTPAGSCAASLASLSISASVPSGAGLP